MNIVRLNKIKLLIIAPTFYPVHGGAGLRFYRYLPYLYENSVDVTVICGTPKLKKFTEDDHQAEWLSAKDGELVSELEISKARILKYKLPGKGAKARTKVLLNKAIELCGAPNSKPDVVHIISPMPYGVIGELRQIKALGIKLIYSHTIARKVSNNLFTGRLKKWKTKKIIKLYETVIVQSESMKESILETNPDANLCVIMNGVDTDRFSPVSDESEKQSLRKELNLPVKAKFITLIGAVHPRKGTDILIKAWASLVIQKPDLHLLIIGPRYDQTRKELKEFSATMDEITRGSGKHKNVHFLGQIEGIEKYLKVSDIFVFPSAREGMPNAVLEAMSAGLPVVLTPFIGLSKELGTNNKEYLLAERSPDSVADKINLVLEDNDLSQTLANNARDWVVEKMDVATSVKLHAQLYSE